MENELHPLPQGCFRKPFLDSRTAKVGTNLSFETVVVLARSFFPIFRLWIPKRCKGVHCVDLGESFPTSIYLQNLASIPPRTSFVKFARSPRRDPPGRGDREGAVPEPALQDPGQRGSR